MDKVMNNLFFKKAAVWNERLKNLMVSDPKKKYTQQSLADAMNKKYEEQRGGRSFTQKTVGRWTRVGEIYGPKKKLIGFPEYETMLYIADFFHVDVGYLTGETDSEKFNIEKTCEFLHLSEEAVTAIERMTNYYTSFSATRGMLWNDAAEVMNLILTHQRFPDVLRTVRDLHKLWNKQPNREHQAKLEKEIGHERFSAAMKAEDFIPEVDNPDGSLPPPTEQEIKDYNLYQDACDRDENAYYYWILQSKVNKYMLAEVISGILDSDYPIPNY